MFQEKFKGVSRKIEEYLEGVLKAFHRYFKEVERVLKERFEGVSWKILACFEGALRVFQNDFKQV